MKVKKIIPLSFFIGGVLTLVGVYFVNTSSRPELLQDSFISLDESRTLTTPLSVLLKDETPTVANAISQIQLLNDERLTIEKELETVQAQFDQLVTQRNILVEEVSPYIESLSTQILNPLNKIKQQFEQQLQKNPDHSIIELGLNATTKATETVEQYLANPNSLDYESSLQTAFKLIDDELAQHDINSVFHVASEFVQSGYSDTMIRMKLKQSKDLLQAFEANYINVENDETAQFKKSMQQQRATEDALDLTALQLDELALRLSGILDEIEQVTQ